MNKNEIVEHWFGKQVNIGSIKSCNKNNSLTATQIWNNTGKTVLNY